MDHTFDKQAADFEHWLEEIWRDSACEVRDRISDVTGDEVVSGLESEGRYLLDQARERRRALEKVLTAWYAWRKCWGRSQNPQSDNRTPPPSRQYDWPRPQE